jgi:hypothetical protein
VLALQTARVVCGHWRWIGRTLIVWAFCYPKTFSRAHQGAHDCLARAHPNRVFARLIVAITKENWRSAISERMIAPVSSISSKE